MSEIGSIPVLNRFALDELETVDGQSVVLMIVESKTKNEKGRNSGVAVNDL